MTLALTATPDIVSNPTDIVLILDRSGSMSGSPLANMKLGANKFIDIIDEATDDSQDGHIGNGSQIGIVSFATSAQQNTQLITSVADLKQAVNSLNAAGDTNHGDAFNKAVALFDPASSNARVIVMFTDGKTTVGPDPTPIAAQAKAMGITIYCIGLVGNTGIDVDDLNAWASDPAAAHVAVAPDDSQLEQLFDDLAENISKPGATNIVIDEIINADFEIVDFQTPDFGNINLINATTLQWNISQLGVTSTETALLEFTVEHVAGTSGDKLVNASISYSDTEGNSVTFPAPEVAVNCITPVIDSCLPPVNITMDGCSNVFIYNAGEMAIDDLGRILELNLTIQNVCPGKRVALAVEIAELDPDGVAYPRGMKMMTIPAHNAPQCQDVLVQCIKFVLPEDINVSGGANALCGPRNIQARVVMNYIDVGSICCGLQ